MMGTKSAENRISNVNSYGFVFSNEWYLAAKATALCRERELAKTTTLHTHTQHTHQHELYPMGIHKCILLSLSLSLFIYYKSTLSTLFHNTYTTMVCADSSSIISSFFYLYFWNARLRAETSAESDYVFADSLVCANASATVTDFLLYNDCVCMCVTKCLYNSLFDSMLWPWPWHFIICRIYKYIHTYKANHFTIHHCDVVAVAVVWYIFCIFLPPYPIAP